MLSRPQSSCSLLNGKLVFLDLNIWDLVTLKEHFCVFCLVERDSGAFSCQDAFTETSLSFQELRALLLSCRSCGLAAWASEEQSELWAWGNSQTDSSAAEEIPEESRDRRHQGKMGPGGFWRQPSALQVLAVCNVCRRTIGRLSASAPHLETSWSEGISCVHWSGGSVCDVLSAWLNGLLK